MEIAIIGKWCQHGNDPDRCPPCDENTVALKRARYHQNRTCACGHAATCFGLYEEGHEDEEEIFVDGSASCDTCCAHGNEDGHCAPIASVTCPD